MKPITIQCYHYSHFTDEETKVVDKKKCSFLCMISISFLSSLTLTAVCRLQSS